MDVKASIKKCGIGLTGGIATGKSTIAKIIQKEGFEVIDADELARNAVIPGSHSFHAVIKAFGQEILLPDGTVNRRRLGSIVFSDPSKKKALEAILHPAIWQLLENQVLTRGLIAPPKPWFYEAALLFETGSYKLFRSIWVTWCPIDLQVSRLMMRNQLSETKAKAIISNQMRAADKKDRADFVIDTSGSLPELEFKTRRALQELLFIYRNSD